MLTDAIPPWVWGLGVLPVLASLFWAWAALSELKRRRFFRDFRSRPDQTALWQAAFPNEMATVDRVLMIFCDAFMLDEQLKYRLAPDDNVAVFYKITTGSVGDQLQYEELLLGIERAFKLDVKQCDWDENLTLGELARKVLQLENEMTGGIALR